jgi:methylated-DNA-[protein]-cysteine S-methyltransferase
VRVSTALGDFVVVAAARGLRAITPVATSEGESAEAGRATAQLEPDAAPALRHAVAAADALRRYAAGEHVRYDGPFDIAAPPFHHAVWERLHAIPFGGTTSYGRIAASLGMPGEAQAVGRRGR